jgi:IS30 family transposase
MPAYTRLNLQDRQTIEACVKSGLRYNRIADKVGRAPETIKEELLKNGGYENYNAEMAHNDAIKRRTEANKRRVQSRKINLPFDNPYQWQEQKIKPERKSKLESLEYKLDKLIEILSKK